MEQAGRGLDPTTAVRIIEGAGDPIVIQDPTTTIVWCNDAVRSMGWEPDDLVGRLGLDLIPEDEIPRALRALEAINGGYPPPSSAPYAIVTPDGTVECDIAPWLIGDPSAPEGIALHLRPTQDSRILRRLLERLLAGDEAFAVIEEMLGLLYHRNHAVRVLVGLTDEEGRDRIVGDALDPALAGYGLDGDTPWTRCRDTGEEVLVDDLSQLPPRLVELCAHAGLRDCWIVPVRSGDDHMATITEWTIDGGPPSQLDTYSVSLLAQLTELVLRWRRQTRELERAATRDPLTGLPNRRALTEFDGAGPRRDLGVLYIDLDRFKPINDRLGHAAGDLVLRAVANRLQAAVRPTDIVARMGGDEFGIVCPGISREELEALAREVQAGLGDPIGVHGEVVTIGSSIGLALGHDSAGPLLALADRALYDAKEGGRGTIRWSR